MRGVRTMIRIQVERKEWFLYDVGPQELAQLVDAHGRTAVALLEWGQCGEGATGARGEQRAEILQILETSEEELRAERMKREEEWSRKV